MTDDYATETEEAFEAFLVRVDAALTAQFGPDHQAVLSASSGPMIAEFVW